MWWGQKCWKDHRASEACKQVGEPAVGRQLSEVFAGNEVFSGSTYLNDKFGN